MSSFLLNFSISMAQRYVRFNKFNKILIISKLYNPKCDPLLVSHLLLNGVNWKSKSHLCHPYQICPLVQLTLFPLYTHNPSTFSISNIYTPYKYHPGTRDKNRARPVRNLLLVQENWLKYTCKGWKKWILKDIFFSVTPCTVRMQAPICK